MRCIDVFNVNVCDIDDFYVVASYIDVRVRRYGFPAIALCVGLMRLLRLLLLRARFVLDRNVLRLVRGELVHLDGNVRVRCSRLGQPLRTP